MRKLVVVLLSLAVLASGSTTAICAAKKAPAKKSAPKASTNKLGAIGTAQMPGEWCELGKAYTLGKGSAMNLTIKSVEFTVGRVILGDTTCYPLEDEKLMMVHFTMHNPLPHDNPANTSTFDFTAVDSKNTNHTIDPELVGNETLKSVLEMDLKPAQKVEAYVVFRVPAEGDVPKLIVKSHWDDTPVARYDLKGKIKGLEAPYVDASDKTNTTALSEIPAQMGTYYPTGNFDVKLTKVEFKDGELVDLTAEEGTRFAVITVTAKNYYNANGGPHWLKFSLTTSDGADAEWSERIISSTANREAEINIKPGAEGTFRTFFIVPTDADLGKLSISEYDAHQFIYDLSGAK